MTLPQPNPDIAVARQQDEQSQYDLQLQQYSLNAAIIDMTNPWTAARPDIQHQLALSGLSPDQLAAQSASMYAMYSLESTATQLAGLNEVAQQSVWGKLTGSQQRGLRSMGYLPPSEGGGGWKGAVGGTLADVWGMGPEQVWKGVKTVGAPIAGPTLDGLVWASDQPAHLYRTIRTMDGEWQILAFAAGAALAVAAAPIAGTAAAAMGLGTLTATGLAAGAGLLGASAVAAIHWGDWSEAFQNTWDGERVFKSSAQRQARELLVGDQYVSLAKEIATQMDSPVDLYELAVDVAGTRGANGSPEQMIAAAQRVADEMADPGTAEHAKIFAGLQTLIQEPVFAQAVDKLNKGKISFGRDIAGLSGADRDGKFFNITSGMIDAAWVFAMDPLLMAGAGRKGYQVARRGIGVGAPKGVGFRALVANPIIDGADGYAKFVDLANNHRGVRATIEQMGLAVSVANPKLMPRASRGMFNSMREWFMAHGEDLARGPVFDPMTRQLVRPIEHVEMMEYFQVGSNFANILAGHGTLRGTEQLILSTTRNTSAWGKFVVEARGFRNALDDAWGHEAFKALAKKHGVEVEYEAFRASKIYDEAVHVNVLHPSSAAITDDMRKAAAAGRAGYKIGEVVAFMPGTKTAGRFLGSITAMAPAGKAVRLVGDGVEDDMIRWVDSMGRIFNLPSGMRDEWLTMIMTQGSTSLRMNVMTAYVNSLFEMSGLYLDDVGKVMGREFLEKTKQAYALGGRDQLIVNGLNITSSIYPHAQAASHLILPDLPELMKIVQRGHVFKRLLKITDANLLEAGMSKVWKPAVIIRIGFIPRAAGEEALAWFARASEGGIAMEFGARMLEQRAAYPKLAKMRAEGKPLTELQNQALLWQMPSHTRPLLWAASRVGWRSPAETVLQNYGTWMAARLATGANQAEWVASLPKWSKPYLLGRRHSWRHMALEGVDPQLREAANAWVMRHADAIMRGTSAQSHMIGDTALVNPDMIGIADQSGEIQQHVVVHGERDLAEQADPAYLTGIHNQLQVPLADELFGPELLDGFLHFFPEQFGGLTKLEFANLLTELEPVQSYEARLIFAGIFQGQQDTWRGIANMLEVNDQPDVARVIRSVLATGDPDVVTLKSTITGLIVELKNEVSAVVAAGGKADHTLLGRIKELESLSLQIGHMGTAEAKLLALGRGSDMGEWMSMALWAQVSSKHKYYPTTHAENWATGATTTVAGRKPPLVFTRGVKDASTLEVRPNPAGGFDLVLRPQWQGGWQGEVVSMSVDPTQSLGYAVSPSPFNAPTPQALVGRGAHVEVDGETVLNMFGTTMDEVYARPVANGFKVGEPGVHYVDNGVDAGEISVVYSVGRENAAYMGFFSDDPAFDYDVIATEWDNWSNRAEKGLENIPGGLPKGVKMFHFTEAMKALDLPYDTHADLFNVSEEMAKQVIGQMKVSLGLDPAFAENVPEIVIPAGKWSIQTEDEMLELSENIRAGTSVFEARVAVRNLEWELDQIETTGTLGARDVPAAFDWALWQAENPVSGQPALQAEFNNKFDTAVARVARDTGKMVEDFGDAEKVTAYKKYLELMIESSKEALVNVPAGAIETKWGWLGDVNYRTKSGKSMEEFQTELVEKVRELRVGLPPYGEEVVITFGAAGNGNEMLAFLEAMPAEDLDTLRQMLGLSSGPNQWNNERLARELLVNGDRHLDALDQANKLRGQGGWTTQEPIWNPFYDNEDDMWAAIEAGTSAKAHRPEHAEAMRASRRTSLANGKEVALQPVEGVDDVWMPTIGPKSKVESVLARLEADQNYDFASKTADEIFSDIVDLLLAEPSAYRLHQDFIRGLTEGSRRSALTHAVQLTVDRFRNELLLGADTALPLLGVGFDDPRLAQWVGDVLTGSIDAKNTSLARSQIPRGLHDDQVYADYGPGGKAWRLGAERDNTVTFIDTDQMQTQFMSGQVIPGASLSESYVDQARLMVADVKSLWKQGTKQHYVVRPDTEGMVFRQQGMTRVPVLPGERLTGREELWDAPIGGNPIPMGNKTIFEPQLVTNDAGDVIYPMVAPMMFDAISAKNGMQIHAPREMYTPRAGEEIDAATAVKQNVIFTKSRITDAIPVMDRLPDTTIVTKTKEYDPGWWEQVVQKSFGKVIGPALDSLVRRPMSFHYYAAAREQNMPYLRWMLDEDLFGTTLPRVFGNDIALLNEVVALTDEQIAAINYIEQVVHSGEGTLDLGGAQRWIASRGDNPEDFTVQMSALRDNANLNNRPELAAAADLLEREINQAPFHMVGLTLGDGGPAEDLVLAFRQQIPARLWGEGAEAVNRYNQNHRLGLPLLNTDERFDAMRNGVTNYNHVYDRLEEASVTRALQNVVPFLDDHAQRSQFAVITRNLLPFWYAEEQFLRRWARSIAIAPEAIVKGQLLYMGMRSAGIVQTDVNGKDWVIYPGSGLLSEVLEPIMPGEALDIGTLFRTRTTSLLPGMNEQVGQPALAPFAAMGVDWLTKMFPEMTDARLTLMGEAGASKTAGRGLIMSAVSQLIPTTVVNVWEAALSDENSSARYASALAYAAAAMQADGQGLPDNAEPADVQVYIERLKNHARIILLAQAVTGFFVPGAPQALITMEPGFDLSNPTKDTGTFGWWTGIGVDNPDQLLSDSYRRLVQNMGIDEGTREFLRVYQDATLEDVVNPNFIPNDRETWANPLAFTTPTSRSVSGAPLPATRSGLSWYIQYREWIDVQPEAGAWYLPIDSNDESFNNYAYSQQLISGLRKKSDTEDFIRSMLYRQAAGDYFDSKRAFELRKEQLSGDQSATAQLNAAWDSWKADYMASNPIFAEEIQGTEARERRARTIKQLRYAIDDPTMPPSPNAEGIREMVTSYDAYRIKFMEFNQSRSKEMQTNKANLKLAWAEWAAAWVLRHPELERLWTSVYEPESDL